MELAKRGYLGTAIDIAAPDIGTSSQIMAWVKDTYTYIYGQTQSELSSCVVGKPPSQGGIDGWNDSAGLGVLYSLNKFLENKELCDKYDFKPGLKGKKVVIEGYGKIGSSLHKLLQDENCIISGIIEHNGSI